jgi:putative Holliday junction resolvase
MGLDVGDRAIGVAMSDVTGLIAYGVQVLRYRSVPEVAQRVADLATAEGAAEIVVGLPRTLTGRIGPQAEKALAFSDALRSVCGLPVVAWDERLTTRVAERALIEAGMSRVRRRAVVDRVAAAVILQGYLDARRPHAPHAGGDNKSSGPPPGLEP